MPTPMWPFVPWLCIFVKHLGKGLYLFNFWLCVFVTGFEVKQMIQIQKVWVLILHWFVNLVDLIGVVHVAIYTIDGCSFCYQVKEASELKLKQLWSSIFISFSAMLSIFCPEVFAYFLHPFVCFLSFNLYQDLSFLSVYVLIVFIPKISLSGCLASYLLT